MAEKRIPNVPSDDEEFNSEEIELSFAAFWRFEGAEDYDRKDPVIEEDVNYHGTAGDDDEEGEMTSTGSLLWPDEEEQ